MTKYDPDAAETEICANCTWWDIATDGGHTFFGHCFCDESDHYGHVLFGEHPKCDEFAIREVTQ